MPDPHDTHDHAFAIGWDHARHGIAPPLERLCINPRLRDGFRAGRAAGTGASAPSAAVRRWLTLRLQALAEGRAFETVRLTPGYLARLATSHCPVTREPLGESARFARLRNDAGYAAGNLALLGARAAAAKDAHGADDAVALLAPGAPDSARTGLTPAQWRRLAMLASFARPLAHEVAAALPLLLWPPPGAMLFNPAQAWQLCIARAWLDATPNRRLVALREALPGALARSAFDAFAAALQARLDEQPGAPTRWLIEDAGVDAEVRRRWRRLALALTPAQCEALMLHHEPASTLQRPDGLATEGWALESAGRAVFARRSPLRAATPALRHAPIAWPRPAPAARRSATPGAAQRALFSH